MPSPRKKLSPRLEEEVLWRCRRRCCLCVFLKNRDEDVHGQIAHLNRNRDDNRFENLVYLCLDHHNQFDSTTRLSKGLTMQEVRRHRDELLARYPNAPLLKSGEPFQELKPLRPIDPEDLFSGLEDDIGEPPVLAPRPWRFPLWQTADQLDYFAYLGPRRMDGVCLIERIDLPDGRVVIACLQMPSNPGTSITNAVEIVCEQVCERFDIPADRLVWLEHYPFIDALEWSLVTFGRQPPDDRFAAPVWTPMTKRMWAGLGLTPRKTLRTRGAGYGSKLRKQFPWPPPDED
jgi:hypothetical protein